VKSSLTVPDSPLVESPVKRVMLVKVIFQVADILLTWDLLPSREMDLATRHLLIMIRIVTLTLLFWAIPFSGHAETVYVNDSLRVGVRSEPNNTVTPHGVVVTGMRLDVLERADGYIKIRNDNGVEGWIRDVYVSPDKPAKLELAELQSEQAKLQEKLARQDQMIKKENAKSADMSAELARLKSANRELHTRPSTDTTDKTSDQTVGYIFYVAWLMLLGVGGFIAGTLWHRKQTMKRLGGLRV